MGKWWLAHRALDGVGEIGLFPGEAAVLVGGAAEMAVGRGAPIDRAAELEGAADIGRPQREQLVRIVFSPGKAPVLAGAGAERAVGRGAPIDRAAELEGAADIGRPQREQLG